MKIASLANLIPFSGAVRSKRNEGEGGNSRQQYDPNQHTKEDRRENKEPVDQKQIDEAIEAFATDAATQQHGLSASREGSGPGLKIAVKDCNGTTLRQFSGEEFLRLREVSSRGPGKRGKILDQKL